MRIRPDTSLLKKVDSYLYMMNNINKEKTLHEGTDSVKHHQMCPFVQMQLLYSCC